MPIKNGTVDTDDLLFVFEKQDRPVNLACTACSAQRVRNWIGSCLNGIDADRLRVQLDILRVPKTMVRRNTDRQLRSCKQFWQRLQPNHTLLLANYPNPFNPETWIPVSVSAG